MSQQTSGARPAISAACTIELLAKANPKKPGSLAHARFALYAENPTVAQYVTACKALGQPNAQRNAMADLAWDAKRGFIAVATPIAAK